MSYRNIIGNHSRVKCSGRTIFFLCFAIGITFVLAEIMARFVYHPSPNRILMWSSPTFETDSYGAVKFAKNASIREVTVYNNRIEYDMSFKTNHYGCADTIEYGQRSNQSLKTRRYAFVGDSFGVGEGGYLWVPKLREKLVSAGEDVEIYNLSVPGASTFHFVRALESASHDFQFTDIVILAITGDMSRPYFTPVTENGRVYYCQEPLAKGPAGKVCQQVAWQIDFHATKDEILRLAKTIEGINEEQRRRNDPLKVKAFLSRSLLLRFIRNNFSSKLAMDRKSALYYEPSLKNLERIRLLFPEARIHFVHLPHKEEAEKGRYLLELKRPVEAMGIEYFPVLQSFPWSLDMFHKNDAHPNILGYDAILSCVYHYLTDRK